MHLLAINFWAKAAASATIIDAIAIDFGVI